MYFFSNYLKKWDLNTSKKIDLIIANSKFVSNDLSKLIKKKVLTIHPPSIKKIYPARAKNIKFNNFKIIFIGRLSK